MVLGLQSITGTSNTGTENENPVDMTLSPEDITSQPEAPTIKTSFTVSCCVREVTLTATDVAGNLAICPVIIEAFKPSKFM